MREFRDIVRSLNNIVSVQLWKTKQPNLPYRMQLQRRGGSIVTSGGINVAEAAVTLFSTCKAGAEFGRIPPRNLAALLRKRFSNGSANDICDILASDKSRFIENKYQDK